MIVTVLFAFSGNDFSEGPEGFHKKIDELLKANKMDEAEKMALKEYKLYPDNAEVICALACCYRWMATTRGVSFDNSAMGLKDGEAGTFGLQEGDIERIFKDQLFIDREKYKKAEKLYFEIIQKVPSYENSYFNLLNDYQTLNDFDSYFKVIDLYVRNLKGSLRTPPAMIDLAGKLFNKQQYPQAEKLYNIIIDNYPDFMPARSDLGVVYATKGKISQALPLLKAVYDKTPDDIINMQSYFAVLIRSEDFKPAFEVSQKMYEKEKSNRLALFNSGLIAYLIGEDYKTIFNTYLAGTKSQPDNKKDFYSLCIDQIMSFEQKSKDEKAGFLGWALLQFYNQKYYEQAIIMGNILHTITETNQSLNIMAAIFDINYVGEKIIYYLDKINESRKTDSTIISEYNLNYNYGRAYYLLGDYKRSQEYLLKNLEDKKDDCKLNYVLGKCYLDEGNINKAREFFEVNANMNDKNQMDYINYSIRELNKLNAAVNKQ